MTGREVRLIREKLKFSRREFSSYIGVRLETLSRWENDKQKVGKVSERLLKVLGERF